MRVPSGDQVGRHRSNFPFVICNRIVPPPERLALLLSTLALLLSTLALLLSRSRS